MDGEVIKATHGSDVSLLQTSASSLLQLDSEDSDNYPSDLS